MKKKLFVLIMVAFFTVGTLAACGGAEEDPMLDQEIEDPVGDDPMGDDAEDTDAEGIDLDDADDEEDDEDPVGQ